MSEKKKKKDNDGSKDNTERCHLHSWENIRLVLTRIKGGTGGLSHYVSQLLITKYIGGKALATV